MNNDHQSIIPVLDYNTLSEDHKAAAEEISKLLENHGQEMLAALIKEKFKLVERPKLPFDKHPFVDACEQADLFCAVQGWMNDGASNFDIPVISITDDARKFINLYNIIKNSN
jgi:hypothetical protein